MNEQELSVGRVFTEAEWNKLVGQLQMSPQQAQIARFLIEGASDKRIAQEMGIAVSTVRTYLTRMFSKLSVQDRNELIVTIFRAFRVNWYQPRPPRGS